jgi:hypothetical protein
VQGAVERDVTSGAEQGARIRMLGRSVLAVLAGTITAGVLIAIVEATSSAIFYPLPPGMDLHDHEAMREHIHSLPIGAFLFVLADWAIGSFAGSWVAARLATRARPVHGLIVGAFFLLSGVLNMLMIPHPWWMWVGGIVALAGCSYLGARLAAPSAAATT